MARIARARAPGATRAADAPAEPDHGDPDHGDADHGDPDHHGAGLDGAGGEGIVIHLDEILAERGMTLTELSERVGITVVNLSVLKNGRARAIRFSTLAGLCAELGCQPGDLLRYQADRSR